MRLLLLWLLAASPAFADSALSVGFAEVDVTPDMAKGARPVYMAGFGANRRAVDAHDPIMVRATVMSDGKSKVAFACADVIGLFYPFVQEIRSELTGFQYVCVSASHNHEGPDTMGLWGPNALKCGVDPEYMKKLKAGIVLAIRNADKALTPVTAKIGNLKAPDLVEDNRLPVVKHDDLVVLKFEKPGEKKLAGILIQWNCHPELLGSKNDRLSADHIWSTVAELKKRHDCPVTYITGTVGGLMTNLGMTIKNAKGEKLEDGTFEKTEAYGKMVAAAADTALTAAVPVNLTPFEVRTREFVVPIANKLYQGAWKLGVFKREAYLWTGDPLSKNPVVAKTLGATLCIKTEVGYARLGELDIAIVPGEIYPELVLDKVQNPADAGADFPDAPIEPAIYPALKNKYRMLIGLGNDEIGYIIPKRQWDEEKPHCYGLKSAQYGEINSLGRDTAPIVCRMFRELVESR